MDGHLRAGLVAGRLQRTLVMRLLRVTSAGVLTLIALLLGLAAEPSAQRAHGAAEAASVRSGAAQDDASTVVAAQPLTSRTARQSARVGGRHLLVARARIADGEGDTTPTAALVSTPAELFGDVADSARARLRRLAHGHAPYGEPSPFDATAPPASSPRNG